jgi:drug/metabolite transporter (DMT)-like permease
MSIFVIGEIPGRFEILTVIVAFTGAAFIVKPGAGVASLPAIVGVAGGVFAGTAYAFVRKLGMKGERKEVIVLFFSVFSSVVCLLFMLPDFKPMSLTQLFILIMAGVSATVGQMNITAAYTYAPAKEISVFDYSQVVFAALLGFLFFGELPDMWSWIGYVIIIGTAIVSWRRNLRK